MEKKLYPRSALKLSTSMHDIYHCWMYNELTPVDGQTNCPKHVDFQVKNIYEINASIGFISKKVVYVITYTGKRLCNENYSK